MKRLLALGVIVCVGLVAIAAGLSAQQPGQRGPMEWCSWIPSSPTMARRYSTR